MITLPLSDVQVDILKLVSLLFRYPDISVVFWVCQVPGKGGRSNKEIARRPQK